MKNRFCRMGKTMIGAFLLLSIGGITYSCQDDYILDEMTNSRVATNLTTRCDLSKTLVTRR